MPDLIPTASSAARAEAANKSDAEQLLERGIRWLNAGNTVLSAELASACAALSQAASAIDRNKLLEAQIARDQEYRQQLTAVADARYQQLQADAARDREAQTAHTQLVSQAVERMEGQ